MLIALFYGLWKAAPMGFNTLKHCFVLDWIFRDNIVVVRPQFYSAFCNIIEGGNFSDHSGKLSVIFLSFNKRG